MASNDADMESDSWLALFQLAEGQRSRILQKHLVNIPPISALPSSLPVRCLIRKRSKTICRWAAETSAFSRRI